MYLPRCHHNTSETAFLCGLTFAFLSAEFSLLPGLYRKPCASQDPIRREFDVLSVHPHLYSRDTTPSYSYIHLDMILSSSRNSSSSILNWLHSSVLCSLSLALDTLCDMPTIYTMDQSYVRPPAFTTGSPGQITPLT